MVAVKTLLLFAASSCSALQLQPNGRAAARPHVVRVETRRGLVKAAAEPTCAVIEMSSDEALAIAQVLKKAWMEGGVKRGLKGAVVAGDEGKVQIVASGPVSRLQSFAEWCSNQLSSEVDYYVDLDACPTVNLSPKFKLDTTAGADNEKWAELLAAATMDVEDASGKSHSSDEGLV